MSTDAPSPVEPPPPALQNVGVQVGDNATIGGDVTGRDKITAGHDVIQAGAGALVNSGNTTNITNNYVLGVATAGAGLRALGELAQGSEAVRQAIAAFRAEFQKTSRQIEVVGDYKDVHDLLHQLEYRCYKPLLVSVATFPEEDGNLIEARLTLENLADQLSAVMERGLVAQQDGVWVMSLTNLPADIDRALNTADLKLFSLSLRRLKQTLALQPSQINSRLITTAHALRLPTLVQTFAQVRQELPAEADLDAAKVREFDSGLEALRMISDALANLIKDHTGWQTVEALLNRIEDLLVVDTVELEMSWPDLKTLIDPLCRTRTEKPLVALLAEADKLEAALAAQQADRIRRSFITYRSRAGLIFYNTDRELKKMCGELRKVGEPLAFVLRMTE